MMVLEGSPAPSCALDVAWSLGMVSQCGDAQEAALLGVASGPAARHSNTFRFMDFPFWFFREACWASKGLLGLVVQPERAF